MRTPRSQKINIHHMTGEIVLNIENVEEQEHERSREAQAKFIREHKARFGVEPNLFDGA